MRVNKTNFFAFTQNALQKTFATTQYIFPLWIEKGGEKMLMA